MCRLRNWLVVACWLGIVCQVQALTLSLSGTSPQAVTPGWAYFTGTVTIDDLSDLPPELPYPLEVTCQNGDVQYYYGSWVGNFWDGSINSTQVPVNFWIGNITGDLTLTFTLHGETTCLLIPCGRITGLEARMAQLDTATQITSANYDQDVFFKAVFNPPSLPTGLSFSDISWYYPLVPITGSQWAQLPASFPGHPTVWAQFGTESVSLDVWQVMLTLKEITLGADAGFRQIMRDPPSIPYYSAPHWAAARAERTYPVLVQVGGKLKATPTFYAIPADWPGDTVMYRATGGYDMGEHTSAGNGPEFQGEEMTATTAVNTGVGHEKPTLNWEYKISDSAYSSIGSSDLDIYRSLPDGGGGNITQVHLACDGVSGTAQGAVLTGIWDKFKSRNVLNYSLNLMKYYAAGDATQHDHLGLIEFADGRCGNWVALFTIVVQIHGIAVTSVNMDPPDTYTKIKRRLTGTTYIILETIIYEPDALWFNARAAQGGTGTTIATYPADPFENHVAVEIDGRIYDPSYGLGPIGPLLGVSAYVRWEDAILDSLQADQIDPWINALQRSQRVLNHSDQRDTGKGLAVTVYETVP